MRCSSPATSSLVLATAIVLLSSAWVAADPPASPPDAGASPAMRVWKDSNGKHQVRAVLLSATESKASFRKANGRLASVELKQLSQKDRDYITAWREQQNASEKTAADSDSDRSQLDNIAHRAGQSLAVLATAPGKLLTTGQVESEAVPDQVACLRISHKFLARQFEREVTRQCAIADVVLGTQVQGNATTTGKLEFLLVPNDQRGEAKLQLRGTSLVRSIGSNGPVQIHTLGKTVFTGSMPLTMTQKGLALGKPTVNATTRNTTLGISSDLPGLRGRIAERVASRRVDEEHDQAEQIAAARAEARIARQFEQEVTSRIGRLRRVLQSELVSLGQGDRLKDLHLHWSTTDACLQVAVSRNADEAGSAAINEIAEAPQGDVEFVVHSSLAGHAISDARLRETVLLLARAWTDDSPPAAGRKVKEEAAPRFDLAWTPDGDWVLLKLSKPSEPRDRVAARIAE